MLSAFEKKEGIALLDGAGVNEADILAAVYNFTNYAVSGKGGKLIDFFNGKNNISRRTVRALALIGMKHVVDEYTKLVNENPDFERYASACADFAGADDEETAKT